MDPRVAVVDAREFVGIEDREHLEVPLSKVVDPIRQVVFSVGGTDDSLKTFLSGKRKQLEVNRRRMKRKAYHGQGLVIEHQQSQFLIPSPVEGHHERSEGPHSGPKKLEDVDVSPRLRAGAIKYGTGSERLGHVDSREARIKR